MWHMKRSPQDPSITLATSCASAARGESDELRCVRRWPSSGSTLRHAPLNSATGQHQMSTSSPAVYEAVDHPPPRMLDVLIRAGLIAAMVVLCYRVFAPFLNL